MAAVPRPLLPARDAMLLNPIANVMNRNIAAIKETVAK
jgi:hypothetical protein